MLTNLKRFVKIVRGGGGVINKTFIIKFAFSQSWPQLFYMLGIQNMCNIIFPTMNTSYLDKSLMNKFSPTQPNVFI